MFNRFNNFMQEILAKHEGQNIAVVSHGDPLMVFINSLKGRPLNMGTWSKNMPVDIKYPTKGSVTECKFKNGKIFEIKELNY